MQLLLLQWMEAERAVPAWLAKNPYSAPQIHTILPRIMPHALTQTISSFASCNN